MKDISPEQQEKLKALDKKISKMGRKLAFRFVLMFTGMIIVGQIINAVTIQNDGFGIFVVGISLFMSSLHLRQELEAESKVLEAEHKQIMGIE